MAIMLEEEGIYQRSRIYATDHSREAVKMAKEGAFPLRSATEYTNNYLRAGGRRSFSDYYSESGERIVLKPALSKNVTFSEHNLATDSSFNEFQVVLCRNVMTHFNPNLRERVHELIYDSLSRFGIVGLGKRESLKYSPREAYYETLDEENRLYRKVI
jgi:chemotaxis protein methyltransferase CheR